MKSLKGTSKFGQGKRLHGHVVFVDDENGFGQCSFNDDHNHEVVFVPPPPSPQTGPDGQPLSLPPYQPTLDEYGQPLPPGFHLSGAFDGHNHTIQEMVIRPPKTSGETEKDIVEKVQSLWKTAGEGEAASMEKFRESEKMYKGEHWDEQEKLRLDSLNRAAVSINMIEKNVDQICGTQRQERSDIRYAPTEGSDQRVADILNALSKTILNKCFYHREESKVFEDAVIGGRGAFNIYVDFSKDLRGQIVIEKFPWQNVRFGPHEKEDISDCEYLTKDRWFSKAKVEQLFPDKAKEIEKDYKDLILKEPHINYAGDQYGNSGNRIQTLGGEAIVNIATKEYRVIECWQKVYRLAHVIVNAGEDLYVNAYGWDRKDIEACRTLQGFEVVEQNIVKFRITKIAGEVLLSDLPEAELPMDDFFVVPVYAKKRGCDFWGKVEPAKDPQRYVNKNYSLALDVGNKMASYGWFYDASTFPDNEKEKFKANSTSPGFVSEVIDVGRPPVKVEGSKFPNELVQLMTLGKDQIADIMNIITDPNGANESGSLFEQRHNQKLLGSEYLFDNLSFAKQKIGQILLKLIQKYYTPERIVRILRSAHTKDPVALGDQGLGEFTDDEIIEMLTTTDLGELDVEVTESQWSPTMRLATFALLRDMQQAGMAIPPDTLFEFADMPAETKKKLMDSIAAQQQAQSDTTSATADMEINKTLIGQGIIPPAVKEKYLTPPQPQETPNVSDQAAGPM